MFIIKQINILLVSKDKSYIQKLEEIVSKISRNIIECTNFDKAIGKLLFQPFDFVITDYNLLDESFTIENFTDAYPETDLIIVATKPSSRDNRKALKQGARDYINIKKETDTLPIKLIDYYEEKYMYQAI
ncbi:MAG: hypothetical protein ACERLG_13600 [Sedimentibacter sp.]